MSDGTPDTRAAVVSALAQLGHTGLHPENAVEVMTAFREAGIDLVERREPGPHADPYEFVTALRARAQRSRARAETPDAGDTVGVLAAYARGAQLDDRAANELEQFLTEGTLP